MYSFDAKRCAMKTICFLLFIITSTLAFPESHGHRSLIGHWKHVENPKNNSEIVFREDGTFSGSATKNGAVYRGYEGKLLIRGTSLYYLYTKVSSPYIKPGQRDRDTILEIGSDYFVLQLRDGRTRRYERIKDQIN